ncbi:protein FAM47E-like isoform X2 [Montipora foliosa]|uniref:protein FAM47E-like isoform X2 n=1 Tax=Montipora foliosa TaxID=591990 RepID=UPI0035F1BCD2
METFHFANMAHKYDLLLVQTKRDEKKRLKPWYKERLETKYIKPRNQRGNSQTLLGSSWTFLEKGTDDFRDGLPPEAYYNYVGKPHSELGPHITGSDEMIDARTKARTRFTKNEACFSKSLPLQQQRRVRVDEIEFNLTQHPLALFPHLEESLPPDVFEDVVEILDPEMNIDSETGEDIILEESEKDSKEDKNSVFGQDESVKSGDSEKVSTFDSDKNQTKPTYKWLPKQEEVQKEESKRASRRKAESPTSDARIQGVTKEFCEWVAGLGGQSNNIEESTVMSLFVSGYETKPALSVPIHVVELTNVPPELRMNTGSPLPKPSDARQVPADEKGKAKGKYVPSWVKIKYGAWYLSPRTWKARPKDKPLEDPKDQQDETLSESKKKSQKLDTVLSTMHGAKAFKEFIDKKNSRVPEFLETVSDQQEHSKVEGEDAKDKKKSRSISTQHSQFGSSQNYVF